MAREIITTILCDVCLNDEEIDEKVEAVEMPPVSIGGAAPKVVALCEEHKADYWEPFIVLLDNLGQAVQSGKIKKSSKTAAKATLPLTSDEELPRIPKITSAQCPECEKVYAFPEYKRPQQALGLHRRRAHGVLGVKNKENIAS